MAIKSVFKKEKTAKWLYVGPNPMYSPFDSRPPDIYVCSNCGAHLDDCNIERNLYCYHCGFKMEKEV